jgi:anthranilate phosphoribosyltransferase
MYAHVLDSETNITFIQYIQRHSPYRRVNHSSDAVNIVGTGGGRSTFNISTTSAFVAAAAGAVVVKSGSNSYTSQCGSLDLLKALKINLSISFEQFEKMLADIGLGFVNPNWYAPILRRLAVTIFPETFKSAGGYVNIMGPLLAPIQVKARLIGVKSKNLISPMAEAVHRLGLGNAIICWCDLGLDEFCSMGCNYFRRVGADGIGPMEADIVHTYESDQLTELTGGSPMENAAITQAILNGSITGVKLDTVLRNAAYILSLAGKVQTVAQGISMAAQAIKSGLAMDKLEQVRRYSMG